MAPIPARVPTLATAAEGIRLSQREGLWDGCGKGGLGAGDPACHRCSQSWKPSWPEGARADTRDLAWPSCLPCRRITGIHPVSSPHPHSPRPRSPCFLEGHGHLHVNVDRARSPSRCCWCQELGPGRQGRGGRCVCLWLYLGERAECGRQAGRLWARSCPWCVPAACPHSLLPQWPHCSQ